MTLTSHDHDLVDPFAAQPGSPAGGARNGRHHGRRRRGKSNEPTKNSRAATAEKHTPDTESNLNLTEIDGHLLRTKTATWAWYRLPAQRWNYRDNGDRTSAIFAYADQLAELSGHWVHLRVTWRPVSPQKWAKAHDELAVDRLPDTPGTLSYEDYLVGEQQAIGGSAMMVKEVHFGVLVAERKRSDRAVDRTPGLFKRAVKPLVLSETEEIAGNLAVIDAVLTGPGLNGWRSEPHDIDWLLTRSVSLGLPAATQKSPVAATMDADDLATYTDPVVMWQEPYAPTTTVHARTGELAGTTRELAVMRVGLMNGLEIPERDLPWMVTGDRSGLPIEWSARFFVRASEGVQKELQRQSDKVRAQVCHFLDEHKIAPPLQLARQAALAAQIEDDLTTGFTARGTRVEGWWSLAVSTPTVDATVEAVRRITDIYKPKIRIEHPEAQYAHAREFIPGEEIAASAYKHRGSVVWASAAMAHVTSHVGDQQGVSIGSTVGSTVTPVAWDAWLSQTLDGSGLTALTGGLGSGKSALAEFIVYKTLRVGARWVLLDPSGPAARLTRIPELKHFSRHVDLIGSQSPGILNPYRVVSEPRREHFLDAPDPDAALVRAASLAGATRRRLMRDVLVGVLPYEVAHQPDVRTAIQRAVRAVGSEVHHSPQEVLDKLDADTSSYATASRVVLDFVSEYLELLTPLMPEPGFDPYATEHDYRLTVLTMPGLTLPDAGSDRRDWETEEQLGSQMLGLAAWLTKSTIYSMPMNARKGVLIDEAHALKDVSTGKTLFRGFTRDSRKWRLRVMLLDQLPQGIAELQGASSLIDSSFTGRLLGREEQTTALGYAGVPQGVGLESVLASFPVPTQTQRHVLRHYLFSDGMGGVERIRANFDGAHLAHVWAAITTRPEAETRTDAEDTLPGGGLL